VAGFQKAWRCEMTCDSSALADGIHGVNVPLLGICARVISAGEEVTIREPGVGGGVGGAGDGSKEVAVGEVGVGERLGDRSVPPPYCGEAAIGGVVSKSLAL
jgi:hypothetical protein